MMKFRKSSRALVLTKENKILLIKRTKEGKEPYYVTPGGGIEKEESSQEALIRELAEETGSVVDKIKFLFHLDDVDMKNSVDFYLVQEIERKMPTGTEWFYSNEKNKYELYEATIEELSSLNLKPDMVVSALYHALKKELYNEE